MYGEIDLHGLTWVEAVETFVSFYNNRVKNGNKSEIVVIHGYGSSGKGGVLRERFRSFFTRNYNSLDYMSGENHFSKNPGQTIVYPKKPLLELSEMLSEEILNFCIVPKSVSKICGKFRRHGDAKVLLAIRELERSKALEVISKGALKQYKSVL
ncbi:MAG: Smr/MutS family protein [Candidatus Riflebacteria bacterium]|nr:Smr/MutS family protein [Candidatus Riflebacteria bacterium]